MKDRIATLQKIESARILLDEVRDILTPQNNEVELKLYYMRKLSVIQADLDDMRECLRCENDK